MSLPSSKGSGVTFFRANPIIFCSQSGSWLTRLTRLGISSHPTKGVPGLPADQPVAVSPVEPVVGVTFHATPVLPNTASARYSFRKSPHRHSAGQAQLFFWDGADFPAAGAASAPGSSSEAAFARHRRLPRPVRSGAVLPDLFGFVVQGHQRPRSTQLTPGLLNSSMDGGRKRPQRGGTEARLDANMVAKLLYRCDRVGHIAAPLACVTGIFLTGLVGMLNTVT